MSISINLLFIRTPVPHDQSKSSKSTRSGHNSLILSFIKFRLYASFPSPHPHPQELHSTPPFLPPPCWLLMWLASQKHGGGLARRRFLTAEEAVSERAPVPAGVNHLLVHLMALALVFWLSAPAPVHARRLNDS